MSGGAPSRLPPARAPLPEDADRLPPLGTAFDPVLDDGLAALGLRLSSEARSAIEAHARLLLAWNRHVNLTAISEPAEVARLHVLDSLTAVSLLRDRVTGAPSILDLGSGGGYPGLPLAVALPASRVALVDSVARKARFLEVCVRAVRASLAGASQAVSAGPHALQVEAIHARSEALAASEHRERWDVVTVRAVGTLASVAELGLPLVRVGGLLVVWKRERRSEVRSDGSTTPVPGHLGDELDEARPAARILGGTGVELIDAGLPSLPGHRLVVMTKSRPTPTRFPRTPSARRRLLR